jgi:hypothetical protein
MASAPPAIYYLILKPDNSKQIVWLEQHSLLCSPVSPIIPGVRVEVTISRNSKADR